VWTWRTTPTSSTASKLIRLGPSTRNYGAHQEEVLTCCILCLQHYDFSFEHKRAATPSYVDIDDLSNDDPSGAVMTGSRQGM
jgi:hypothetical protein